MKIKILTLLPVVTALFVGLTLGIFLGRNTPDSSVTVTVEERRPVAMTVPAATPSGSEAQYPININTADKETLSTLPGIGEILAQRILAYRQEHGAFTAVEQLMNVEGIGEGKLEGILDQITIGG